MRTVRIVLAFVLLSGYTIGMAPPAQAFTGTQSCQKHEGPDGPGGDQVTICVVRQQRLCCFADTFDYRALMTIDCQACRPEIRVAAVNLQYKPSNDPTWNNVRHVERMTWTWTGNVVGQYLETPWHGQCPDDRARDIRAKIIYQLKWYGTVTGWFERNTESVREPCGR